MTVFTNILSFGRKYLKQSKYCITGKPRSRKHRLQFKSSILFAYYCTAWLENLNFVVSISHCKVILITKKLTNDFFVTDSSLWFWSDWWQFADTVPWNCLLLIGLSQPCISRGVWKCITTKTRSFEERSVVIYPEVKKI